MNNAFLFEPEENLWAQKAQQLQNHRTKQRVDIVKVIKKEPFQSTKLFLPGLLHMEPSFVIVSFSWTLLESR